MATLDRVNEIFADAKSLHAASVERLAAGNIRDAAENAWLATKQATDALILARIGRTPESHLETSTELERLAGMDPRVDALTGPYCVNFGYLHQECARLGLCDPVESAEQYIR